MSGTRSFSFWLLYVFVCPTGFSVSLGTWHFGRGPYGWFRFHTPLGDPAGEAAGYYTKED